MSLAYKDSVFRCRVLGVWGLAFWVLGLGFRDEGLACPRFESCKLGFRV